ncbi:MAG: hypothetical protein QOD38_568, partial [Acidimicrobiaceae bacterium]
MRILGARGALGARRTPVLLIGATVVAVLCFAGAPPADASPAAPHLARQVATASAPGDPDATFGQGGRVTTNLRFDRAIETVVQSIPLASGDVLAIVSPRLFNSFSLRRFHADGSIDVTFANGGVGGLPSLPVMAVDASGRIIVAGSTGVAPSSDVVSVRRYSASGALDQTFAGDGAAEIDRGFYEAAAALTLQSDGKPVLVVSSFSGRSLVRLDAAGVPDTSFSGDGDLPLPNGNTVGLGVRVAGQVLVASSNPGLTLHQFLSDGTPDGLFGTSGAVTVPVGSATIRRTQLPSDGRLVFAGESANDLLIGRVTKAGVLDNTFSNDGLLTTDLAPIDQLDALTVDPPGRVLVVSDDQGSGRFVSRITPGGVPDSTFGASGVQPFNGPALQQVRDIDAVPGGGILLSTSVGFAKLQATGLPNTAFGNFGVVHPGFNSPTTDFSFDTVTQPDGRIIVAGVSNDVGVVARYNANGSLDSTFGSAGLRLLTDGAGNEFVPVSLDLDATGRVVISAMGNSQWNAGGPAVLRTTFAGSLDATFGGDGIVDLPTLGSGPMAAQGDPGGGAVIAGAPSGGGTTTSIVRIAPNGAPDAGFGGTGTVTVDLGAGSDSVKGVDLTSAGEVVVLGSTSNPVVVARLTAAGVPDAAFGGGAPVVVTAPAGSAVLARELIVKPDGLVAIGGEYCFQ